MDSPLGKGSLQLQDTFLNQKWKVHRFHRLMFLEFTKVSTLSYGIAPGRL